MFDDDVIFPKKKSYINERKEKMTHLGHMMQSNIRKKGMNGYQLIISIALNVGVDMC